MAISSNEINFLIQRYFQECGFDHSFYTFNIESQTDLTSINGSQIPPGALITLLQKGLLYIQLEKEINSPTRTSPGFGGSQLTLLDAALREGSAPPQKAEKPTQSPITPPSVQLDSSNFILLDEHSRDVLCCSWSHDNHYLASGSTDGTAIIWDVSNAPSITSLVLQHSISNTPPGPEVRSLDWSADTNLLATGCSDGSVHVWDSSGARLFTSADAASEIHVVRFDPSGRRLVSGDAGSRMVIRTESGEEIRAENLAHGSITDAAWRSETALAVGCDDGTIAVSDADVADGAARFLRGHTGSVNGVAWSNSGELLASCSDDKTVRVWAGERAVVLAGHTNVVYVVRWNANDLLASSSFDSTVRFWDARSGACLQTLASHTSGVYSLAFTPDGTMVASGSADQMVKFWKVPEGQLLVTLSGSSNSFDLQFDKEGATIAIALSGGNLFMVPIAGLFGHQE